MQVGEDEGSASASRTSPVPGSLSLAPLQGGSAERCQYLWQIGKCLASSDIQELSSGLEVSRDPLSER